MNTQLRNAFSSLVLFSALAGCSGNGGGNTGPIDPPGQTQTMVLMVGRTQSDELSSLQVTFTGARLVHEDGSESTELLSMPRTVDLVDTQTDSQLLQVSTIDNSAYTGLRLSLDQDSVRGRDLAGNLVDVDTAAGEFSVRFADTASATPEYLQLRVDFDLDAGLSLKSPGLWEFTPLPVGIREFDRPERLDELHGHIQSTEPDARRFVLALTDPDTGDLFGSLTVQVVNRTAFVAASGARMSEERFFAVAEPRTKVEIHGELQASGLFVAFLVELEAEDDRAIQIKGTIVGLDLEAAVLKMRIRWICKGSWFAHDRLAAFDHPPVIAVDFSNADIFICGTDPRAGSPEDLRVGQHIKAEFKEFGESPFPAARIKIRDLRAEFEGTIIDNSGLPERFLMRLGHTDPTVLSNTIVAPEIGVNVHLDGDEPILLQLQHEPKVGLRGILPGLRARVRGTLSRLTDKPGIHADDVRIRPGRLGGRVRRAAAGSRMLLVEWEEIGDPFGGRARLPNPVLATFARGAVVDGEASSVKGLFELWESLEPNQTMVVRVAGISDGQGGIWAHLVKVGIDED